MPPPARHNLPVRLTSFVGREGELAAVGRLVGEARLVTLTGAGGAGKTRLAVEFAAGAVERFGDGVWLAELAGLADAELVPSVVMEALGVRQSGEVAVLEALVTGCGRRSCCWCWTTASICSVRAPIWRWRCWAAPGVAGAGDQPGAAGRSR